MRIRIAFQVCLIMVGSLCIAAPQKASPSPGAVPTKPLITRAVADDVGLMGQYVATISFMVQVATGSAEDLALRRNGKIPPQLHVWLSGEEMTDGEILSDTPVAVGGLVLVDIGPPSEPFAPKLDPAVSSWLRAVAAERRGWTYRFVAGDHTRCRISREIRDGAMSNPDKALSDAVAKRDPKDGEPFFHEEMSEMADLFTGKHANKLVVLGTKPPVWVPRELTEWLSRLPGEEAEIAGASTSPRIDESIHRLLGREAQWAVSVGDGATLRELAELIAARVVVPVIVKNRTGSVIVAGTSSPTKSATPKPTSVESNGAQANDDVLPEAWRPLSHGVEELFARAQPFHSVADFLAANPHASFQEHRVVVRVPLSGLQRPASGAYVAEVALQSGNQLYRSRETTILDRAATTLRPPLLWVYIFAIVLVTGAVLAYLNYSHREKSELSADHAAFSRNVAFGCAGGLFALCTSLVGESESLSLLTAASAFVCGGILAALGFRYLVQHHRFEQAV
jgi:hypothetical protein